MQTYKPQVRYRLTAKAVAAKAHSARSVHAERLADGGGLYLQITATGAKSWLFRYTLEGKAHLLGLGRWGERDGVSLADARVRADAARAMVARGADPVGQKQAAATARKAIAPATRTFKAVAENFIRRKSPEWRNAHHAWQWQQTLYHHAYPVIGKLDVSEIETAEVRQVLDPIWEKIPETAQRLRGRIEAILDAAKLDGLRSGDNPARWKGHLALALPSPRKIGGGPGHHPALPWAEVGAFLKAAQACGGTAARALEFLILTAARTGEVIGARWREMDLEAATWTVPGDRMKAGREHRVPLSGRAVALLRQQEPLGTGPDGAVFQSGSRGSGTGALSNMAMLALLRRMNVADDAGGCRWRDSVSGRPITAHGFRSTFRDWAGETTNFPRDVAEAALAHTKGDKTEASYARGDLFVKRRAMMVEWADFCAATPDGGPAISRTEV